MMAKPDHGGPRLALLVVVALTLSFAALHVRAAATGFVQTNLVSGVSGPAPVVDPNLKVPWGIAVSPNGPFWVANHATNTVTIYDGAGQPFPSGSPLVVGVPLLGGGPTGAVFNPTSDFNTIVGEHMNFLFASDESIAGWNPSFGSTAAVVILASGKKYTGIALAANGAANFLYAADSAGNTIDVYDTAFASTTGFSFLDPGLPGGFVPYNVQNLGGTLFVTYKNDSAGGGIVNAFRPDGTLIRRVAANPAGGVLDAPWGLAIAPAGFAPFGGALLVGNGGNGRVSAFDPATGQFLGQLLDTNGVAIANPGLRGIAFGNGGNTDVLYFAAALQNQTEGLFGAISAAVPPAAVTLTGSGYITPELPQYRASFMLDVTGPNPPSGTVQYYYARTRLNFAATTIASMAVNGSAITVTGTGTVGGAGGYTFSANASIGVPQTFGIEIRRSSDNSLVYLAAPAALAGGSLALH